MARSSFGLGFESSKRLFFDRLRVLEATDRANARVLSRFGAFVRTRARTSMRSGGKAGKSSPPGVPPRYHGGSKAHASLRNVLFAYDPAARSVVVGPVLLNGRPRRGGLTVPALHEFGGTANVREVLSYRDEWVRPSGKRWEQYRPKRTRPASYPARPFMRPAFQKELGGKLRAQLRGMLAAAA